MNGVEKLHITDADGGAVIAVKAVPGSSRERIVGPLGDCLKIATAAPAEKGKANAAIAKLLASALGLEKRRVELLAGSTSPRKEFRLLGLSAEAVRHSLRRL